MISDNTRKSDSHLNASRDDVTCVPRTTRTIQFTEEYRIQRERRATDWNEYTQGNAKRTIGPLKRSAAACGIHSVTTGWGAC